MTPSRTLPMLLAALALAACPTDPDPGNNPCPPGEDFCIGEPPSIEVEPTSRVLTVLSSTVDVGGSSDHTVRVTNSGIGKLLVTDWRLDYTAPDGASEEVPALQLVPPVFSKPAEIFTKNGDEYPQGVEFTIRYTRPDDEIVRNAKLVISSNDPAARTVTVDITTESGAPQLITQPDRLDFSLVPKGQTATGKLKIINTGSRTLSVSGFRVSDVRFGVVGEGFEIGGGPDAELAIDLTEAILVPEGESRTIDVTFTSDSPTPAEGELLIFSDDPESGSEGHSVPLVANKSGPCIQVSPRNVKFGGKLIGAIHTVDVEITSCGTEPLNISSISMRDDSSPDFDVDLSPLPAEPGANGEPLVVPINESVTVNATFVPDEVNPKDADNVPIPDEGTIQIASNAFESLVEVPVTGAGAEGECPVAVIKIDEGEEVIPQTVLHLDGTQSYAPFGEIKDYFWSVEQPDGSTSVFLPSGGDPEPVFEVNVVGVYKFTLRVRDENNVFSDDNGCSNAEYTVIVQPDTAIHVELTWETPGDTDETDTGEGVGSDLDLHFTHPNATGPDLDEDGEPDPWFDELWDCFWHNPNPNWASFDPAADDDPSLDRDDTDGAGPENLNLGEPEDDGTYRVGVHYWDDHGFGEAIADIRIYSYATLVYEVLDVTLFERDMWCVAHVTWLGDAVDVVPCGEEGAEAITPDYVNPFFFQP